MQGILFIEPEERVTFSFEELALRQGYCRIAGIDEAGRGPLAGPVVAAAVILPTGDELPGVNDSKKLSPKKREMLFDLIRMKAVAVGVGMVDHDGIDGTDILRATLAAMRLAVEEISPLPDFLLVDGISAVPLSIPQKTIKQGDATSLSIAAASIIAKVTRDRLMEEFDRQFPGYGFAAHKGYGCATHLKAIASLGPCPIHRKSFRGVKEHVGSEELGRSR